MKNKKNKPFLFKIGERVKLREKNSVEGVILARYRNNNLLNNACYVVCHDIPQNDPHLNFDRNAWTWHETALEKI